MSNPCLSCGACCAYFRASFHWLETTAAPDGITPAELTVSVTQHLVAMRGSDRKSPRCIALAGDIGESVRCTIYQNRASPCRDFQASWVDGQHNERCDRARAAHGLPPLPPPVVMLPDPGFGRRLGSATLGVRVKTPGGQQPASSFYSDPEFRKNGVGVEISGSDWPGVDAVLTQDPPRRDPR